MHNISCTGIWLYYYQKKGFFGCKCAFEIVSGNWNTSFVALPRYMDALKHFNLGTDVELKHDPHPNIQQDIFKYVFWAFKSSINGSVDCPPVIYIDYTHVYGSTT